MSVRRFRARSFLVATAMVVGLRPGVAFAQSVNVGEELMEVREPEEPALNVHPWQWLRHQWLDEMATLDRLVGLQAGVSFTTIYQHAAGLPSPNNASVANLDLFGRWKLLDLGPLGTSTVGYLFRNRSVWTALNGNELSDSIGLPWGINNSGSSSYTRLNQLWWQQSMLDDSLRLQLGRLDEKALFDQNRVAASDAKQFLMQSLVHSQTIAFPSNGMGFNLRWEPSKAFYATAGFGDANGNPDNRAADGVASFGRGKYFEAAEVGWSPDIPGLERGTYRFMGWHTAATNQHKEGSGVALSVDQEIGDGIVPFLRLGYCPDDVFQTSVEASWGVATVRPFDRATDLAGIGATWGRPVPTSTRDQFAMDLFYRLQVVEGIQISPDVELVFAPALQPGRSFVAVFGLRSRIAL